MKSSSLIRPSTLLPLAAALALSLSACGGGGGGGGTPSGTASFGMTDAPVCAGLTHVYVTVTALQVIGTTGTYSLTLPQPVQIDLTTLANGNTLALGKIAVPAGSYQQLRLMLASSSGANYVVNSSGASVPLMTPSAQQSGYKINGQFSVAANGQTNLTVDFNACRSVVMAGNSGKYILKPVLNLVDDDQAGSITGYLPAADVGAVVMAEDSQGHILKTTVAAPGAVSMDSSIFTLAPLPASSTGYNVVIAPPQPGSTMATASGTVTLNPNFAPEVILNVPVVAGSTPTALGTQATPLPVFNTTSTDQTYSGSVSLSTEADTLFVAQETLPSSGPVISIAQVNGVESDSSSTTETYSMTVPTAAPYFASFGSTVSFVQISPAPTVTIQAYASDGETGSTTGSGTITVTGGSDTTFEVDH